MLRCSESLVINTLNQSEGVPAEAESGGKENFWNGLCRKAKHTGFRKKHWIQFVFSSQRKDSSSLQNIASSLLESALPCSISPCSAKTASPSALSRPLVSVNLWWALLLKTWNWSDIHLSLVFSWECVVWSVSLAVLLFPFSGSNLGHLTLHS